jgi:hypothetical protein
MMSRYLSGLSVGGLGLCGGGWLVVAALAFGGESGGRAGWVNLLTGAVLIAVGCLSLVCWSRAWRQRLRADGVLADRFPLVSRREARRNRRALSRDVRRAGKLAQRSARGARRAARRSARLASGGALSEGGVLGEGVALGVASPGDEQYGAAASYGTGVTGSATNGAGANATSVNATSVNATSVNATSVNATSVNATSVNATAMNGTSVNGTSVNGADAHGEDARGSGVNAAGANPGERAAELISELRSMLEPLLAATGGQPALAEQLSSIAGRPSPAGQTPAAASPLPQRSRFASDLKPRATAAEMAMPRVRSAPMSIPRLASAADDSTPGPASDGEDAWW